MKRLIVITIFFTCYVLKTSASEPLLAGLTFQQQQEVRLRKESRIASFIKAGNVDGVKYLVGTGYEVRLSDLDGARHLFWQNKIEFECASIFTSMLNRFADYRKLCWNWELYKENFREIDFFLQQCRLRQSQQR